MKNLISELLVKLAEKEEESKKLTVQVEALEIIVTAILRKMHAEKRQEITDDIVNAIPNIMDNDGEYVDDASLLHAYLKKLLYSPRY